MKITAYLLLIITFLSISLQTNTLACELSETAESQEVMEDSESEATIENQAQAGSSQNLIETKQNILKERYDLSLTTFEVVTPPPERK